MTTRRTAPTWTPGKIALVVLPAALVVLSVISLGDVRTTQQFFVHTTYYFLMATVLCWAGTYIHAARELRWKTLIAWAKENWPGLVIALALTVVALDLMNTSGLEMVEDHRGEVGI